MAYRWAPTVEPGALGHAGYALIKGKRQLCPAPESGLHLYVNTEQGRDEQTGRSPAKAWRSPQKALMLLANTTLNAPCTVHVTGDAADAALEGLDGTGTLTVELA